MVRTTARIRALCGDTRAATIVEFALVALPFLALIVAIIQTSIVFFAQQCLETTAEETARQLMTGSAQKAAMDQSAFAALACRNLPSFMKCANTMVDVRSGAKFADVDTTAPALTFDAAGNVTNAWQYVPGGPGSVVVVKIMYLLPVVGAPLGFDLSTHGKGRRLLVSTLVFKSEQYAS